MALQKFKGTDSVTLLQGAPAVSYKTHSRQLLHEFAKAHNLSYAAGEDPNDWQSIPPVPKEDDLYSFPFRHLSAVIVGSGSWKASDFTTPGVLEASVPLLKHVPAYTNHFVYVGNEIGYVGEPVWRPSYVNKLGQLVPAGIDAPFVIDVVLQPRLVRQLNSKVSPVRAASVTVDFEWEASHEFEREYDFYYHLGEIVEGTEVRRIVTKINKYYESSLVWEGADPNAKLHNKDGEVELSAIRSNEHWKDKDNSPELKFYQANNHRFYIFDGASQTTSFNSGGAKPPLTSSSTPMNEKLLAFMAQKLGKTVDELNAMTAEQFESAIQAVRFLNAEETTSFTAATGQITDLQGKLATATQSLTTVTGERDTAKGQVVTLTKERDDAKAKVTELEPLATAGTAYMTALRTEATNAYNKFSGGNPDAVITAEIAANNAEQLAAKIKLYGGESLKQFGAFCSTCNSGTNITMRQTEQEKPGGEGGGSFKRPSLAAMARR